MHFGKVSTCEFLTLIHFSLSPLLYMLFCSEGLLNPMNFESEENNTLNFYPLMKRQNRTNPRFKEQQEMLFTGKPEKGSFLCSRRTTPCSHCPSRLSGDALARGGMRRPWVGTCMYCVRRGQRKALDALELGLQVFLRHM